MRSSKVKSLRERLIIARYWLGAFLLFSSWMSFAEAEILTALIAERLGYMRDVAAYKWQHALPIPDIAREQFVIKAGMIAGLSHGVTLESSERFYRSQIEAAKDIQRCWHLRWRLTTKPINSVDLNSVIRPTLIDLGNSISAHLSNTPLDAKIFNRLVQVECLSLEAKQEILKAAQNIRHYSTRFRQIKDSGVLRVGTTGDYAPFSFSANNEIFTGIDIDLAYEFASHLNTSVMFIQTSWPTLMADFADGKFDIGMSGISITDVRKRQALFSKPYHVGGKTPIARCNQIYSFSSIATIDQIGTRIIVNPGGTNQRFLDENIRQATILMFEDNRDIFQQIVNGRADLMITDQIEVTLQSALHPELCGLSDNATFTYQEKGFMMPNDSELQTKVNNWLDNTRQNGRLQDVFDRHLSGS